MWLITNFGFFSIVEKPEDQAAGTLTIRARVKSDLVALQERYLPSLGKITGGGTDYKCRAKASREAVAVAMMRAALDINYDNFKNSVGTTQGHARASLYHEVWDVLYKLQQTGDFEKRVSGEAVVSSSGNGTPIEPGTAYGGVLLDDRGRMLLVEPANHYDNTVWTWPKGKPEGDATVEAAALREVFEETGYRAQIVARVPGSWRGTTGKTEYFIMKPLGSARPTCNEIASTKWVDPALASCLIQQTTKDSARQRDLEVLAAAIKVCEGLASRGD